MAAPSMLSFGRSHHSAIPALFFLLIFIFSGCGQDGVGTRAYTLPVERNSGFWSWVSGDDTINQTGVYGEKGVADASNKPGARAYSLSWADGDGNLWLFGGSGYDGSRKGSLGDLWKFDGNWSWVSGDNTVNQAGVYGTQGIADAANKPGARSQGVAWTDGGNFWLFGGSYLGDLWKFDGAHWTWVSGSSTIYQLGVYGTQGVADEANRPGARVLSTSWSDGEGNLWLFGGYGYDGSGLGYLGDLWKFDGVHWTWVSGSSARNQEGVCGVQGVADAANQPGTRRGSVGWTDGEGNIWLFGGYYYELHELQELHYSDLWKFDGAFWTWVSGDNTANQAGVYGAKGVADASNKPGARRQSTSWADGNGNFWLFGGYGYDSSGLGYLNDLWKFDGTCWTWVSGDSTAGQTGEYGTKGVADAANTPGARWGGVGWVDESDHLWLFGGYKDDGAGGYFNDLWVFEP